MSFEKALIRAKLCRKQTLGGNVYTKRYGYYKQGDHATNRVNTIYYGKNGITDGKTTYTYDGMGNIISVNENGKQRYKYTYDKIGRLISEKDLYNNKEVCYTYDNSGNIQSKNIDGQVTEYRVIKGRFCMPIAKIFWIKSEMGGVKNNCRVLTKIFIQC